MSRIFEIGVFTASTQPYCDPIVAEIDKPRVIAHKLYRRHCSPVASKKNFSIFLQFLDKYVKDLRCVSNWRKQDIVIIDNLIYSFAGDLENGIPIKPYIKGKEDYELEYIANILDGVRDSPDVMMYMREVLKLNRFYHQI